MKTWLCPGGGSQGGRLCSVTGRRVQVPRAEAVLANFTRLWCPETLLVPRWPCPWALPVDAFDLKWLDTLPIEGPLWGRVTHF